jgi:hypothetical protein
LREIHDEAETPTYFGLMANGTASPPARVEYALRGDDLLSEIHVRQVMELYLGIRRRRMAARTTVSPISRHGPVTRVVPAAAMGGGRNGAGRT